MRALAIVILAGCGVEAAGDHAHPAYATDTYSSAEIRQRIDDAIAALPALPASCAEGGTLVVVGGALACEPLGAAVLALDEFGCPPGFTERLHTPERCRREIRSGFDDEMVQVGDVWVDRYEATACDATPVGTNPLGDFQLASACSVVSAMPVQATWFRAMAMCANAGKRLCTSAEWQAAAYGTPDPGAFPPPTPACSGVPSVTFCNTCSQAVGRSGTAPSCVSAFGAHDMIGNLNEWVAEWRQAGPRSTTGYGTVSTAWPQDVAPGDRTGNVAGTAAVGSPLGLDVGMVAAVARGGGRTSGMDAGVFAIDLRLGPSALDNESGFRCCAGGTP